VSGFLWKNDKEIYAAIKSGKFFFRHKIWESVSQEVKSLITKLLDLDFDKSATAEEAIKDQCFMLFEDEVGLFRIPVRLIIIIIILEISKREF
jgi:hypothetical protein